MATPVTVNYIDTESEIASVTLPDGSSLGVNLWEIEGHERSFDGSSTGKYSVAK